MTPEQARNLLLNGRVQEWNQYRRSFPEGQELCLVGIGGMSRLALNEVNLEGVDFHHVNLSYVDFSYSTLRQANLQGATLGGAGLSNCDLTGANLSRALLVETNFAGAKLVGANLTHANLGHACLTVCDLRQARLDSASLMFARMARAKVEGASFRDCRVYGLSVWELIGVPADQTDLIITYPKDPVITVDSLEVAQFIYLLIRSEKIRHIIDTITSKVVLILGRFTPERKAVLDAIRAELRKPEYNYVPVVFDFDRPTARDTQETITTLARLARFIIADITEAKSIPQELVSIVEQLPSVPIQPILHQGVEPWGMYDHIRRYPWVLEVRQYGVTEDFMACLREVVIEPLEAKIKEIRERR